MLRHARLAVCPGVLLVARSGAGYSIVAAGASGSRATLRRPPLPECAMR